MPSRASVCTSTASACSRNSSTSIAVTVSRASSFSSRPRPSVVSISSPGMQATSNHDTRRVNTALNQHEVSVRSRNQYSVVGDSGKVVRALEVHAGPPGGAVARRWAQETRVGSGATGAADESRTGASLSARALRAGFHDAAGTDGGHDSFRAEHRQTGQLDDARVVRALPHGAGLCASGPRRNWKTSSAPLASSATRRPRSSASGRPWSNGSTARCRRPWPNW